MDLSNLIIPNSSKTQTVDCIFRYIFSKTDDSSIEGKISPANSDNFKRWTYKKVVNEQIIVQSLLQIVIQENEKENFIKTSELIFLEKCIKLAKSPKSPVKWIKHRCIFDFEATPTKFNRIIFSNDKTFNLA